MHLFSFRCCYISIHQQVALTAATWRRRSKVWRRWVVSAATCKQSPVSCGSSNDQNHLIGTKTVTADPDLGVRGMDWIEPATCRWKIRSLSSKGEKCCSELTKLTVSDPCGRISYSVSLANVTTQSEISETTVTSEDAFYQFNFIQLSFIHITSNYHKCHLKELQ